MLKYVIKYWKQLRRDKIITKLKAFLTEIPFKYKCYISYKETTKLPKTLIRRMYLNIDDAINYVINEVEQPALEHPDLEQKFKNKVKRSKIVVERMKKIGDLYHYLQRFENIVPKGNPGRELYDRFKELNLKTSEELFPEFAVKFKRYIDDVTVLNDFVIGKEYSAWDISIFSRTYDTQSGIYLIGEEPNFQAIFVKATFEKGKYPNKWLEVDQTLKYYMYSLSGKFKKEYKYNKAILNSNKGNIPIYVFQKEKTMLILKGIFQYKSNDYESEDGSRWFILQKVNTLKTGRLMTEKEYNQEVLNQVKKSARDSSESRKIRLEKANSRPGKVTVSSTEFNRNPDVIAEVLERARGVCEKCYQPAPFVRKDLTPYLEVHHEKPLAEGGEDTVENAVAVCPNCHKEDHFAAQVITIVKGIIIENEKVLIGQRDEKWEFPGGKIKPGETIEFCLYRELYEKLGIKVTVRKFFVESIHQYSSSIYRHMSYVSKPITECYKSNIYKDIQFVDINELNKYKILQADKPIVEELKKQASLKVGTITR